MKTILVLFVVTLSSIVLSQELKTQFANDFSRWTFGEHQFSTTFINDYSKWDCGEHSFRTVFIEDWDNWRMNENIIIKTTFHDSFDNWTITGLGSTIYVKTTFINDKNRWTISGDLSGTMTTAFHNDYSNWKIDMTSDGAFEELKIAVTFIAIFSAIHDIHQ